MDGFFAKNRKISVFVLLFALLFWLITAQVKNGRIPFLERPFLAITGAVERVMAWPFRTVSAIAQRYLFLVNTEAENRRLAKEVEKLKIEDAVIGEVRLENERLRQLLGFKAVQPAPSVPVQIIGKDLSPTSSTFTINKGSDDGIRKDMPVVTRDGVVGKVQTVLSGTSKVILLTDPGSTLAVRVERNREEGLLEGRLVACSMKYVSYYADIKDGDLLVTSGLDGIYPKGLPVATVTTIAKHEATSFQSIVANPVVPFSRLEEALVLLK